MKKIGLSRKQVYNTPVCLVADRLDLNANWWRLVGPGRWADPDCIMCGHFGVGPVAEAQCRSVFAVFAVTKSPLLLGAQIWNFTAGALSARSATPLHCHALFVYVPQRPSRLSAMLGSSL